MPDTLGVIKDNRITQILRCPACKSRLSSEQPERFLCLNCKMAFPLKNGVADFIIYDKEAVEIKSSFQFQWEERFSGRMEDRSYCFGEKPEKIIAYINKDILNMLPSCSTGKLFLDAGCGSADKAIHLAKTHPEATVVAFDLSDTVAKSKAASRDLANIVFLKADVNRLPFAEGSFDFIMSFGVLHHTSSTELAFKGLAKMAKATDSAYLVWLYLDPRDDRSRAAYYARRDFWRRFIRGWPYRRVLFLCRLLTFIYFLPKYLIKSFLLKLFCFKNKGAYPKMKIGQLYRSIYFVLFDNISPAYQERSRKKDVLAWYGDIGYKNLLTDTYDGLFCGFK